MRLMLLACACGGALALTAPAAATVYTLSYEGTADFFVPMVGATVSDREIGTGTLELDDAQSSVSLSDVLAFSFTTFNTETSSYLIYPTQISTSTRTYSLADLNSFYATVSGDVISSLNFDAGLFYAASGTGIDNSRGPGRPSIIGNISAAVPEPGTWATMLAGFGLVGLGLRRRRTGRPARG